MLTVRNVKTTTTPVHTRISWADNHVHLAIATRMGHSQNNVQTLVNAPVGKVSLETHVTPVRTSTGTFQHVDHVNVIHLELGTMWAPVWSSLARVSVKIMWRVTVVIHAWKDTFKYCTEDF